jgi:hypothetical protein
LHFAGGWWNADVEDVIEAALAPGGGYSIPDALTINGQPGFLYNYSSSDASRLRIRQGESYQLRVVNACLNFAMYFAVANHSLNVRELDAAYCVQYPSLLMFSSSLLAKLLNAYSMQISRKDNSTWLQVFSLSLTPSL